MSRYWASGGAQGNEGASVLRFGSHLSVAGGLYRAVETAAEFGLDSLQLFTANQRQWKPKAPDADGIRVFRSAVRRQGLRSVASHASYLINLASPDEAARRRSARALGAELDRCTALSIGLCVIHPGAHLGRGEEEGVRRIAATLDEVYAARPNCKVRTLLETTAGAGHVGRPSVRPSAGHHRGCDLQTASGRLRGHLSHPRRRLRPYQ